MPYIGNQPGTGVRSRFIYTATASQTTFSGADDNSKTLKYADSDYIDVFLNGVCLVPGTDYTASTKTSIVLTQAASLSDTLEVVAYDIASMADTVSKADGGTFEDGITIRTADNTAQLTLESTDDDAGIGPHQVYYRNSSSPADNDLLAEIDHRGRNDNSQDVDYATVNIFAEDVSDGTEDGKYLLQTMKAGAAVSRMDLNSTETVFNDDSKDIDFRVESNGDAHCLFVDGANDKVGIGIAAPLRQLHINNTSANSEIAFTAATNGVSSILFGDGQTGTDVYRGYLQYNHTDDAMLLATAATERARIDSSGFVLVGKTSSAIGTQGISLGPNYSHMTSTNDTPLALNRKSSNGTIFDLRQDGTQVASIISYGASSEFSIGGTGTNTSGLYFSAANEVLPLKANSLIDASQDLGKSNFRWAQLFASTGSINTSDENEKQNIASLTSAEITAATAISKLFKTYKWKDRVVEKGDAARTHAGVIAQQVQTAMSDAGLDASKYSFWCSDTWWEKDVEVAAVEADEEKGIEAKDAYTRTDSYDIKDEAPEGATEHTRMGIRYAELLAFIGAATEQRLTSIEARLTALEGE